jgi:tRNA pseudouridine38-40 synthase
MAEGLYNIKLILAYEGTRYHGWQRQSRDLTLQGLVEEKLKIMLGDTVTLHASGRTDAGVHALNQVCHFHTPSELGPEEIRRGLNAMLPDDLFVKRAAYVPHDFHARYSALGKTYEYRILNREEPDVFQRNHVWHVRLPLDLEPMAACLRLLEGPHDFSAFQSTGSQARDPVRTMRRAELRGPEEDLVRLTFEADGFLRHMVRNMVGSLVDVGLGKTRVEGFKEILASRDRRSAGFKAPARGLYLVSVQY